MNAKADPIGAAWTASRDSRKRKKEAARSSRCKEYANCRRACYNGLTPIAPKGNSK